VISLLKLTAKNRIEHPSRNSDLVSFGKLDYKTFLVEAAQSAHYFDFCSIKGMMSVVDPLQRQFVSSMMIRCGIVSRPIFWKVAWIW
jgi:hypothetical protein